MGGGLSRSKDAHGDDIENEDSGIPAGTLEVFNLVQKFWSMPDLAERLHQTEESTISPEQLDVASKVATSSQEAEFQATNVEQESHEASMRSKKDYRATDLHAWLQRKRREKKKNGKLRWKKKQLEMLFLMKFKEVDKHFLFTIELKTLKR